MEDVAGSSGSMMRNAAATTTKSSLSSYWSRSFFTNYPLFSALIAFAIAQSIKFFTTCSVISLAIFLNDGLASETSDISTTTQSESAVVQPEWLWGRPLPRGPWGRPAPKWPIPGHGVALPPLPARKFPPLPPVKGSGSDVSDTEQIEIAEQADRIEQDDSYYQQDLFFHPYIPGFRRPFPRPFFPRRPFPGWGALPPRPAHH